MKSGDDPLKTTVIVLLTVAFVTLYVLAIVGRYRWDSDKDAIGLLQPIVYVIIGFYFGRVPSEASEKAAREDAASKAREARQASEKLDDVRRTLARAAMTVDAAALAAAPPPVWANDLRAAVDDSLKIIAR